MTHTERWWNRRCKGVAEVELANGKRLTVGIYKEGGTYWVDRVLVNPANSGSMEEAIRYIGVIHGSPVKDWRWSAYRG
jgi:hypothetical protein